jgi:hypothetical protein
MYGFTNGSGNEGRRDGLYRDVNARHKAEETGLLRALEICGA